MQFVGYFRVPLLFVHRNSTRREAYMSYMCITLVMWLQYLRDKRNTPRWQSSGAANFQRVAVPILPAAKCLSPDIIRAWVARPRLGWPARRVNRLGRPCTRLRAASASDFRTTFVQPYWAVPVVWAVGRTKAVIELLPSFPEGPPWMSYIPCPEDNV